MLYEQKIDEFFQKIQARSNEQRSELPIELEGLIQLQDLNAIYDFLLQNEAWFKNHPNLRAGQPYRLDKADSRLPRTLNFIMDPQTGDIALILETKSKNDQNTKNTKAQSFSGSFKTTKVAWRIDQPIPQKMANAVYYVSKYTSLDEAYVEANAAQKVIKTNPGVDCFVNAPALGDLVHKQGIRKSNNRLYTQKQSFYSSWAAGKSLAEFLKTKKAHWLTIGQLDMLARQLLIAVKSVHDAGMIHQDIKPDNILVYKDALGNYRVELADFGKVYIAGSKVGRDTVSSTVGYQSPEIAAIKKDPSAPGHKYYYDTRYSDYGRVLGRQMASNPIYAQPDKANDLWAIGIVLHELYHKKLPRKKKAENFSPLIAGLLNPNRALRFTSEQALTHLELEQKINVEKARVQAAAKEAAAQVAQQPDFDFVFRGFSNTEVHQSLAPAQSGPFPHFSNTGFDPRLDATAPEQLPNLSNTGFDLGLDTTAPKQSSSNLGFLRGFSLESETRNNDEGFFSKRKTRCEYSDFDSLFTTGVKKQRV
jgi:hypothetical protein